MKKTNPLFNFVRWKQPEASGTGSSNRSNERRVHPLEDPPAASISISNVNPRLVVSEQPKPSSSPHWVAARSVITSPSLTRSRKSCRNGDDHSSPPRRNETASEDQQGSEGREAQPTPSTSSMADVVRRCSSSRPPQGEEDAVKVKKRRLAQRQRRLNPHSPLDPQHHRHPFIRIAVEGDEAQSDDDSRIRFLCKAIRRCTCGIVSKCLITGEDTRNCVRGKWTAFMRKKAEWDRWNPDRNHPLVQWINESKLAGLKETVKPNKGILYRIQWLLIFLVLFGGGLKFSIDTYHFHKNSPILFGFKTSEVPIESIPFPTVTVCPSHAFQPSTADNAKRFFKETLNNHNFEPSDGGANQTDTWSSHEAATLIFYMDHICSSTTAVTSLFKKEMRRKSGFSLMPYETYLDNSTVLDGNDQSLNKKLTHYLTNVSLNCENAFRFCIWNLEKSEFCDGYFRSVLTNHGGCCSFNQLPLESLHKQNPSLRSTWERQNPRPWKFGDFGKWSNNSFILDDEAGLNSSFPARQKFGGRPWGLTFIHKMEDNGDCAQYDSSGSRISISIPGTDFDVAKLNVAIPPKSEVFIKLTPELTTASEELRTISPELRGCYFQDEKPLAFYNKYSQENCYRECVANFTLTECGCTLISNPNSAGSVLCQGDAVACARNAEGKLFSSPENRRCKECLPSCSQMTLKEEITSAPLLEKYQSENSPFGPKDLSSIVHLYYGPSSVIAKERQLRHGKYELLSHMGSIFETTNDISVIGAVRTISSLYVFYPTTWELLKLLVMFLLKGLKKYLSFLTFCLGNRQRVIVHNAPVPMRMVNVIEIEDVNEIENGPHNINFDVFLVHP